MIEALAAQLGAEALKHLVPLLEALLRGDTRGAKIHFAQVLIFAERQALRRAKQAQKIAAAAAKARADGPSK